jgi:hypothetical protein
MQLNGKASRLNAIGYSPVACGISALISTICLCSFTAMSPVVEVLNETIIHQPQLIFVEPGHWQLRPENTFSSTFSTLLNASLIAGVCRLSINLQCLDQNGSSSMADSHDEMSRCLFGREMFERLSNGARPCMTDEAHVMQPIYLRIVSSMTPGRRSNSFAKVAMIRSVSDPKYLPQFGLALASALTYADYHGYSVYVYVGIPAHFPVAGHFSRVPAIFSALYHRLLDFDWVSYDDLDSTFNPKHLRFSIDDLLQRTYSPILINDEKVQCSCSQFYRKDQSSVDFLRLWWDIGHTTRCCHSHSFDQIAWWEALSRTLQNNLPLGSIEVYAEPQQKDWPLYCKQLQNAALQSRSTKTSRAPWPIGFISGPPFWHGSPWGNDPEQSVVYHTGHQRWVQEYRLLRSWAIETKNCAYSRNCSKEN